ncbi:hypothetical protein [Streptomyces sp. NBC_00859]|uniref:hypothetical protein n=1 Tax=Streptomyces sp. NBC_00859 TaxID=2903682 RepID=UPI00386984C5|nr:hypothetical protein OG584_01720 [Streptomyces sp. NBC_00859]
MPTNTRQAPSPPHRPFQRRYKKRKAVERAISRLKNSRAVATRHEKCRYVFLGTVSVVVLVIWLRS